jgi:hypothetical protein
MIGGWSASSWMANAMAWAGSSVPAAWKSKSSAARWGVVIRCFFGGEDLNAYGWGVGFGSVQGGIQCGLAVLWVVLG